MAKPSANSPDGWTDEMISEFLLASRRNLEGQVNALIMIEELERRVELFQSELESSFEEEFCLLGRVASKKGNPLAFVRANIRVTLRETFGRSVKVAPNSVGLMYFSQQVAIDDGPRKPILEIVLFGDSEVQRRIVQYLADARLFGIAYVPLWVWLTPIDAVGTTANEAISFSIENALPISKCEWQQGLGLGAAVPQDYFDPAR